MVRPVEGPATRDQILERLGELRAMREAYQEAERSTVIAAREAGLSWESIGRALGRDRSSVWEKYHYDVE